MLALGYNAALVATGAGLLGVAAGVTGSFLFLRKRALVSDAMSHATLPGLALAFMVMTVLGGDGRALPGLLAGSALSAWLGVLTVSWLSRRTRLGEDAAIGAVLSVFFGLGIVGLTVIQSLNTGRQAGLETFLLGSTAGMLFSDALTIALGGALTLALAWLLRRPMLMVAFDPDYATATGRDVARIDLAMLALALAVTVVGLKIVGLILIVALLIIPPVAARFWSDRADRVVLLSGIIGGGAGVTGALLSGMAPDLPTGPIIVLIAFGLFAVGFFFSPGRGVLAAVLRHRRFQRRVHMRQGLLAIAQGQPVYERLTLRLLRRAGLIRADAVATDAGRAVAAKALLDEHRWQILRADPRFETAAALYDGLRPLDTVLTPDQLTEIDRNLRPEAAT
ncbi:metal ABC transporter permease [Marimonas arenosa]|uniref:Metal ABC transporter permease n=1 Tax=Marimonas arenosa TaxID=1795305 RepID=A0AAE4B303_9RHOB|nr:metal ABC transporter permease [Marimonas arenosa]MDQ2089523.1 metal ABC transporter permease [Marimonas arenosa]